MTHSEYVYNTEIIEQQRTVVKILVGDEEWFMDWDDWSLADSEGRDKPVIYKDKLIMVDNETFEELKKLEEWIKINDKL